MGDAEWIGDVCLVFDGVILAAGVGLEVTLEVTLGEGDGSRLGLGTKDELGDDEGLGDEIGVGEGEVVGGEGDGEGERRSERMVGFKDPTTFSV